MKAGFGIAWLHTVLPVEKSSASTSCPGYICEAYTMPLASASPLQPPGAGLLQRTFPFDALIAITDEDALTATFPLAMTGDV
jgi:hypothetical protein